MKKIPYVLTILAVALASCSKQDGSGDLLRPEEKSQDLQMPSNFGRKILFEEFTGAWCGYCPRGNYWFEQIEASIKEKAIGVSVHVNDIMEAPQLISGSDNLLDEAFQNTGYPNGLVDRGVLDDPSNWPGMVPGEIGLFAKCGFAIDATSISGSSVSVTIHTGFASNMYGDYRLNVWVTESDVHSATNTAYDQVNYYSSSGSNPDPSLPYYNDPPVINDFHHPNVLRKLLTSVPYGDQIPQDQMVKGNDYITTYTADLTGFNSSNCYIVVFVDKYSSVPTTDPTHPQHQVQNAQKGRVGSLQGWN